MLIDQLYLTGFIIGALIVGSLFVRLPIVRRSFIPGSMVAGLLLLLLGPQIAGVYFPEWQLPTAAYDYWSSLPGQLINVVFACLFLVHTIVPLKQIWRLAAPQAAFGQMLAWGQYALGGLAAMFILIPFFDENPLSGALIEISFEGGHGTASGLVGIFDELGFSEGYDLAVGLATFSLAVALISGILLVHWGEKRKLIRRAKMSTLSQMIYHRRILYELKKQGITLRKEVTPIKLVNHLLLVAVAIGFGWLLYQGLLLFEAVTWGGSGVTVFGYLPLFPLCMFGGMMAHWLWQQLGLTISQPIVGLISAFSLAVLITTAIATMSLSFLTDNLGTFLVLGLTGVAWILLAFIFLAPRMFATNWFQNGIVNMAQSMGQTATGLLFVKMVDPHDRTNAIESFGYKQLLFEPFVGGGIVTALSLPAIVLLGLPLFTTIAAAVCLFWLLLGILYFGRRN